MRSLAASETGVAWHPVLSTNRARSWFGIMPVRVVGMEISFVTEGLPLALIGQNANLTKS